MFGFSGASRSGKTTLAKLFAEKMSIPYIDSSTTVLMSRAGFNPVANLTIENRVTAQEALLKGYKSLLGDQVKRFVTDRTPIDMLAYTLAEVNMHNTNKELSERIHTYCEDCIETTRNMFSIICFTDPLAHYEAAPDKPPPSIAYQNHIHLLIKAALDASEVAYMQIPDDTIEQRINMVMRASSAYIEHFKIGIASEVFH